MSLTEYWFVWAIPLSDIDKADALGVRDLLILF